MTVDTREHIEKARNDILAAVRKRGVFVLDGKSRHQVERYQSAVEELFFAGVLNFDHSHSEPGHFRYVKGVKWNRRA